jgi:hypothetical protein
VFLDVQIRNAMDLTSSSHWVRRYRRRSCS